MADDPRGVIDLSRTGIDPEAEAAKMASYKEKIANARSGLNAFKGNDPVKKPLSQRLPLLSRENVGQPSVEASPMSTSGGVQPRPPGSPVLRQETIKSLEEVAKAQGFEEEEVKKAALEEKEDLMEAFNFDKRGEAERILDNKKRRDEIEKRCEPMALQDLIMRDEVRQKVPIVPGEFEVVFRSLTPEESLFIKQQMSKEIVTTDSYLLEKYALCQLCCSLVSINGRDLPDHRKHDGSPEEEAFRGKMKVLLRKSGYIVADLGVNYAWFDMRVRKLINPDQLKNG